MSNVTKTIDFRFFACFSLDDIRQNLFCCGVRVARVPRLPLVDSTGGPGMSGSEVSHMITTVGFPIVCVYFMWIFVKTRVEAAEDSANKRETASLKREADSLDREKRMADRIDRLEDEIRNDLSTLIRESKDVMAECSGTMVACTEAFRSLKRADSNVNVKVDCESPKPRGNL